MSGTGGAAREVVAVSSTSSESSDEHALLVRPAEGVTVGGKFFAFHSWEIELKDRKLSEDELLPLLESFRDGKFPGMYRLNLVTLDCVQYDENAAWCDSCAAGWKPNRRQMRGNDRRRAEGQPEAALAPSCKALFLSCVLNCCWGVVGEDGEGLGCSVRSCIW